MRNRINTVINLQEDFPDPDIEMSYFDRSTMKESAMCQQLGVRYVFIAPDLLHRNELSMHRPKAIDQFLALLDDPTVYPILLHCKAGLHRTGVMVAVYRMEKEGWTPQEALREAKANGFGEWNCTSANDYVAQYVIGYRGQRSEVGGQRSEVGGQRSEVGGQRSEVRKQTPDTENRDPIQNNRADSESDVVPTLVPTPPVTVRVLIFKNDTVQNTVRRGFEFDLTQAVIGEIDLRTPFKVVGENCNADTELTGTIVDNSKPLLDRSQFNEAREAETAISVHIVWRDLRPGRSGETLSQGNRSDAPPGDAQSPAGPQRPLRPVLMSDRATFTPDLGRTDNSARQQSIDSLARQIVSMMEKPW